MSSSVIETVERLKGVIDPRAGVIGIAQKLPLSAVYEGVVHGYSASVGRLDDLHPDGVRMIESGVAGYGTAMEPAVAEVRALAEALERYCALLPPRAEDVLRATPRQLGHDALDVGILPRCSANEVAQSAPHTRLLIPRPDDLLGWVDGWSLSRQRHVWVPLTAVYLGLPVPLDQHVAFPISTGFAAGVDYEQAVLAGLLEVIERDSLALWWLHQLPFPRIGQDLWRRASNELIVTRAEAFDIHTTLFDLTTDVGVPVVGLVQESDRSFPHLLAMAACRPTAAEATLRILEEAASLRTALSTSARKAHSFDALLAGEPQPPEIFGLYYADKAGRKRFPRALLSSPIAHAVPASLGTGSCLEEIVVRLMNLGMEVVIVDVTVEEVRDVGLVVVKVLVPELVALTFCHAIRYLGHPRLYDLPPRLGFGCRSESDITREPIPYA